MSKAWASCPFCGGEPRHLPFKAGFYDERVICDSCSFYLPPDKWNRRTQVQIAPASERGEGELSKEVERTLNKVPEWCSETVITADLCRRVIAALRRPAAPAAEAVAVVHKVKEIPHVGVICEVKWTGHLIPILGAQLYLHASPAPSEKDAEDARRYRWLRDGCNDKDSEASLIVKREYGAQWDASIDAAIDAAKEVE